MTEAMAPGRVRQRWHDQRPALLGWCSIGNGYSAEILASGGVDAVVVDLQHGMFGFDTAVGMLQSVHGHGIDGWARIDALDPVLVMHVLDAGATGVICPMVSSRDDAERFVAACRYPPSGVRSYGPSRNLLVHGPDYVEVANDMIVTMAMVETADGLEALEDICAVSNLDGVYIGPNDLAMSMGWSLGYPFPLELHDAVRRMIGTIHGAGKRAGTFCSTPDMVRDMAALGFDVITLGNDATLVKAGLATFMRSVEP